jgi:hypothetical protein
MSSIAEAAAAAAIAEDGNNQPDPNAGAAAGGEVQQKPADGKAEAAAPATDQQVDPNKPKPEAGKPSFLDKSKEHMQKVLGKTKDEPKDKEKAKDKPTEDDFEKEIKPNQKAWRLFEGKKKEWQEKESNWSKREAELSEKIKLLESKPNPTAADDTKLKALEKQLADLENQSKTYKEKLVSRDYRESDEFKDRYEKPWQDTYKRAYAFMGKITLKDEAGEERRATPADFDKVMSADPDMRRSVARQIFGEEFAFEVADYAKELTRLNSEADRAAKDHAANYEKTQKETMEKRRNEEAQLNQFRDEARNALVKEHPDQFSIEHYATEPEFQGALQSGYDLVDEIERELPNMTVQDRAAAGAVIRAHVAGYHLATARYKALEAMYETALAELKKFQKSDPGGSRKVAEVGGKVESTEVGGIKEAVNSVKWT